MNRALIEEMVKPGLEELTIEGIQAATGENDAAATMDAGTVVNDASEKIPLVTSGNRLTGMLYGATGLLRGAAGFFTGRVDEERLARHDSQLEIYSIKGMFR